MVALCWLKMLTAKYAQRYAGSAFFPEYLLFVVVFTLLWDKGTAQNPKII